MSKSSALGRVLGIIEDLKKGKTLNLTGLTYQYNVSERTVRRDIELIAENLHDGFIQRDGENIYAVNKDLFKDMLSGSEVASLVHIFNVFKQSGIKLDLDERMQRLVKDAAQVYDIKNKPMETFTKKSTMEVLEKAIRTSREVTLKYRTKRRLKRIVYRPYKVTMLNENFYLLGTTDLGEFQNLRINMIEEAELSPKSFYKKADVNSFVRNIQTPFARFGVEPFRVKVEVSPYVSKYFRMKKFLDSQMIEEEKEDGTLVVSYEVTDFKEVDSFVIQWLPNMKVVEPLEFKEHLKKELEKRIIDL